MTKSNWIRLLKVGDRITRLLAGTVPMGLIVTAVTPAGWEIDEELDWGPAFGRTGSVLVATTKQEVVCHFKP